MKSRYDYGPSLTADLSRSEKREWLVTNGIGGYACGTVAGLLTRRYHALLMAALDPPVKRTLVMPAVFDFVEIDGEPFAIHLVRWADGTIDRAPAGRLERFRLEGSVPVWSWSIRGSLLEKRIWMEHGENTTLIEYRLVRGSKPVSISITAFANWRDDHGATHASELDLRAELAHGGFLVSRAGSPQSLHVHCGEAEVSLRQEWYYDFDLAEERARGFAGREDHFAAATIRTRFGPGGSWTLVASTESMRALDPARSLVAVARRDATLLDAAGALSEPEPVQRLILAADQFIVRRGADTSGSTIIAGYPWFTDWGRDTMISLPGLTLMTGRPAEARAILGTFAHFVSRGMIPNQFPDRGEAPEFNTVDATLWFIEAIRQEWLASRDLSLVRALYPTLLSIIEAHREGTRFGIGVDPSDGLLRAGEPGVQVTWMDAKIGEWVVTPRIGKPVEVNALWYRALCTVSEFSRLLGSDGGDCESLARKAKASFGRFRNPETGGLFDVLEGPDGDDASIRPNQIFAVSLDVDLLSPEECRGVVDVCAEHLLTPMGLRSLAPSDPCYNSRCSGDPRARDAAYHQGTVWGWLLGPFAIAHERAYQNAAVARSFLEPMLLGLDGSAIGTLGEIFDADPPYAPRGCFAQAWTVGETLRAWRLLTAKMQGSDSA